MTKAVEAVNHHSHCLDNIMYLHMSQLNSLNNNPFKLLDTLMHLDLQDFNSVYLKPEDDDKYVSLLADLGWFHGWKI